MWEMSEEEKAVVNEAYNTWPTLLFPRSRLAPMDIEHSEKRAEVKTKAFLRELGHFPNFAGRLDELEASLRETHRPEMAEFGRIVISVLIAKVGEKFGAR